MRVTFLTHYYPPEVGAPQARISGLAGELSRRGIEVTVHTCFPHYPDGVIQPPYRNRPWLVEPGEVRVVRSVVHAAPNRGFARRIANHASFALSSLVSSRVSGPADVVVVETPPLFLAGAAIGYARLKRAPLVAHVADLWPDSAIELGALRHRGAISAARALERATYRAAAAIVCPTDGIKTALAGRPEAASKVRRIGPSVEPDRFIEASRSKRPSADGRFQVLYAGTVGMSQGLETLVDAAALLEADHEVEIVIAGDGADAPSLKRRIAERGPGNVRMIGAVPYERVPGLYAESDAAAVLLRDRPLFRGALPTKMLEAMSAGKAVVLSGEGEAASLIEAAACGLVVPPEDPHALAAAVAELAADRDRAQQLGAAGRRCVAERFTRARAADQWMELLESLA